MKNGPTPEALQPLIKLLADAGEDDLARRLAAHSDAKQRGVPLESMVKLWLD